MNNDGNRKIKDSFVNIIADLFQRHVAKKKENQESLEP